MNISFIIVLKNRIRMEYISPTRSGVLELLPNNLKSLCNLIQPADNWEFVVIDFASTDADVDTFLRETLTKPNMSYKLKTLNEPFNKGKGLNMAVELCTHDVLFFLDADMIIRTYDLFNDIQKYVIEHNKVFFPICWHYDDPDHVTGQKLPHGVGNVVHRKSEFVPYIEKETWGAEDTINYNKLSHMGKVERNYYEDKFVHQWHPRVWQQPSLHSTVDGKIVINEPLKEHQRTVTFPGVTQNRNEEPRPLAPKAMPLRYIPRPAPRPMLSPTQRVPPLRRIPRAVRVQETESLSAPAQIPGRKRYTPFASLLHR